MKCHFDFNLFYACQTLTYSHSLHPVFAVNVSSITSTSLAEDETTTQYTLMQCQLLLQILKVDLFSSATDDRIDINDIVSHISARAVNLLLDIDLVAGKDIGDGGKHTGDVLVNYGNADGSLLTLGQGGSWEVDTVLDSSVFKVGLDGISSHGSSSLFCLFSRSTQVRQKNRILVIPEQIYLQKLLAVRMMYQSDRVLIYAVFTLTIGEITNISSIAPVQKLLHGL